jgi:hypothetical protein
MKYVIAGLVAVMFSSSAMAAFNYVPPIGSGGQGGFNGSSGSTGQGGSGGFNNSAS